MSVATEIQRIQNAKADIKTAIENKGGTVSGTIDNYATAIDNLPSGGTSLPDWSEIGYSSAPQTLLDNFDRSVSVKNNWDASPQYTPGLSQYTDLYYMPVVDTSQRTSFYNLFSSVQYLEIIPSLDSSNVTDFSYMCYGSARIKSIGQLDTSKGTNFLYMFRNCAWLKDIPVLNLSSATSLSNMLYNCSNLTDASLDNILQSCISAASFTGTKTLAVLGIQRATILISVLELLLLVSRILLPSKLNTGNDMAKIVLSVIYALLIAINVGFVAKKTRSLAKCVEYLGDAFVMIICLSVICI